MRRNYGNNNGPMKVWTADQEKYKKENGEFKLEFPL